MMAAASSMPVALVIHGPRPVRPSGGFATAHPAAHDVRHGRGFSLARARARRGVCSWAPAARRTSGARAGQVVVVDHGVSCWPGAGGGGGAARPSSPGGSCRRRPSRATSARPAGTAAARSMSMISGCFHSGMSTARSSRRLNGRVDHLDRVAAVLLEADALLHQRGELGDLVAAQRRGAGLCPWRRCVLRWFTTTAAFRRLMAPVALRVTRGLVDLVVGGRVARLVCCCCRPTARSAAPGRGGHQARWLAPAVGWCRAGTPSAARAAAALADLLAADRHRGVPPGWARTPPRWLRSARNRRRR